MYVEFLEAITAYIKALNAADKDIGIFSDSDLVPGLGRIPVILSGELCGFLADEIGGQWSYQDATPAEREAYVAFTKI